MKTNFFLNILKLPPTRRFKVNRHQRNRHNPPLRLPPAGRAGRRRRIKNIDNAGRIAFNQKEEYNNADNQYVLWYHRQNVRRKGRPASLAARTRAIRGAGIVVALDGTVMEGNFPPSKLKMLQVWIDIHADELRADWQLLLDGETAFKIEPLK
jgi:hypothetical protein